MARRDFVAMNPASSIFKDSNMALHFERMRENIELLTGQRGDSVNYAILRGDVTTQTTPALTGVTGVDLANLKATLDALIIALKG